ncbi:unnamed protein product [Phaedon cochleariae]|uniref:Cilia- and flagella-associated protein 69 ARM repeats domain-containing protein n=1 Tax=Phaedon cochleariae TaxID=80249 RepID=A0A9P0DYN6_PHACE|nr:unnamed protein product [Phaedon cochleariae]
MNEENQRLLQCSYSAEKNPSELIRYIVTLLEHRITKNDKDRHTGMILNFIQISQNGFLIRDLAYIIQTIGVLSENHHDNDSFKKCLEQLLNICSIPPLLTLSSDIITFVPDMQEFFSFLGCLLVTMKEDTRKSVLTVVSNLLKNHAEQKWYASLEFRRSAAGNSQLPEILGQLLASADDQIYPDLLPLLIILTKNCMNTHKIIKTDALNSLLRRIEPTWRQRFPVTKPERPNAENKINHFEDTFVIICSLLDHLEKHRHDLDGLNNIDRFSLWNLQYAFQFYSQSQVGYLNRNNVAALILRMMNLFPESEFVVSGLAEDIVINVGKLYSFREPRTSFTSINQTATDEDYNYIKLILISIPIIAKLEGGLRILERVRIIYRLLRIISRPGHPAQFPKAHGCVIQIFCWDVLKKLVPFLEEEFIENSGPHILLECMKVNNLTEEGLTILVKCLGAINYMLRLDHKGIIINSILYNDGISILLSLCENFLTYPFFNDPVQQCLKKIFSAITMLCQFSTRENPQVVPLALKYLRRFLSPEPVETVYDNRILICLMDFIWEIIVKSENLSPVFIKEGGVHLMLDIVQVFPFPVQMITLGALVDLCEDAHCIPYLITWMGKQKVKLLPLLMSVFREENEQLQVKMDYRGRIEDPKCPLMGKYQWNQTFNGQKKLHSNPTISDLFLSARPKIYAILNLLNERYQEVVELANEQYQTFNDKLSAKDQMTMLLADNFLALKFGEAWKEVEIEFDIINFDPTQTDKKIMSSLLMRAEKWGEYLKETQSKILQRHYENEMLEEQKLYVKIGESCISEALDAVTELKYIARCIERMFRISEKHKQHNQIERSLRKLPCSEFLHRTYLSEIRATPVFNLTVSVKSNIIDEQKEEAVTPVSPMESVIKFERKSQDKIRNSEEPILYMKLGSIFYSKGH